MNVNPFRRHHSAVGDQGGGERATGGRRFRLVNGVLVAIVLALVVLCVVFGIGVRSGQLEEQRRQEVVAAARQLVVNLTNLNHDSIDNNVKNLLDGTTGDFQRQFQTGSSTFAMVVKEGKVVSTGEVRSAGVDNLSPTDADVLVAVHSTVRNSAVPSGEARDYRLAVTLRNQEGRWLVSNVIFVP
jgi:Mce-associated membrane protein